MEQKEQHPDIKEDLWKNESLEELSKRIASASFQEAGVERNFSHVSPLGAQPK